MFEILDVTIQNDMLLFSDGYTRIADAEEINWFKKHNPKGIKTTVKDVKTGVSEVRYMIQRFFDYHRHSEYSLLDGCIKISDMIKYTDFAGAITDHGNMYAYLKFYEGMKKAGKLPVIGEEFYCETIDGDKNKNHLILLAKNNEGLKNLMWLSSSAFDNFYGKPHISYQMLKNHSKGLICTSACLGGEIPRIICNESITEEERDEKLKNVISFFKDIFKDDFYLEIQNHSIEDEKKVNPKLLDLSKKFGIKIVAATDAHYTLKEDEKVHDVVLCISTKKILDDPKRMRFEGTGYHLHNYNEVDELFKDIPDAIDNTLEIMEKCQYVDIKTGVHYLPDYPLPEGFKNNLEYLKYIAKKGFYERFKDKFEVLDTDSEEVKQKKTLKKQEYWDRWKYEMSVIENMGFSGYFLVVWDFLKFCRDNNIPVGAGRGSGAGSLVLYCLYITDFDPIKYDLLFERFLNPSRISLPDIDSDISDSKRELVIDYVNKKYGQDHVSHIITFGTLAAKSALRDVGKVLGLEVSERTMLQKAVPNKPKITLNAALKESSELRDLLKNEKYKQVFDIATKIEGLPRQTGIHACGIIISKEPITSYCPLASIKDENGEKVLTTQLEGPACESVGLVKFDFLGLRTLDVVDNAISIIKKRHKDFDYTPSTIPIDDVSVYAGLKKGETMGVFQFESDGMISLLKQMFSDASPEDTDKGDEYFERLIAAVALYRPGPMAEIPNYINAMKSGNIIYDHPKLKSILSSTYGILVYQEEIMMAVRELAGFSKGDADTVRKAMGKKKIEIMNEYGEYFIYGSSKYDDENPDKQKNIVGCVKNGIPEIIAKTIWDKMVKFAEYAFNKSHATCYAGLGARTAWLLHYYPSEYMVGILNSYIGSNDKISKYVIAAAKKGITVLPPNVNTSGIKFEIDESDSTENNNLPKILFGLSGIKNVGAGVAKAIVNERKENGVFLSYDDFIARMAVLDFDKGALESLILSGALDIFEGTRRAKFLALEDTAKLLKKIKKEALNNINQLSLFDAGLGEKPNYKVPVVLTVEEYSPAEKAMREKERLGYYLKHPVLSYSKRFDRWKAKGMLSDIGPTLEKIVNSYNGFNVRFAGVVGEMKTFSYLSKKNNKYESLLTFMLDDGSDVVKCVAFGNDAIKYGTELKEGTVIYILGYAKADDFGVSVSIKELHCFDNSEVD